MGILEYQPEHKMFRKTIRDFVEREVRPYVEKWEDEGRTPREIWKKVGDLGCLGILYPAKYGGMDADHTYCHIFLEEIAGCGSSGVSMGLAVQLEMSTPALARYGSEELKEKYLVPSIKGEMITAIGVTEPGCGSDVASIKTKAVEKADSYIITGRKMFITNGSQADFVTLLCRTSGESGHKGLSLIIVPTKLEGFRTSRVLKKTCYPSSDTAELILDNVKVPKTNLIGEEGKGFIYQMQQFQFERLGAGSLCLGTLKRAYEITKRYVFEREAFGGTLASLQVTRHKMAWMLSQITLLESFVERCVVQANQGVEFTKEVSMMKLVAAEIQQQVLEECVQLHGGYGLMAEYEIARYFRDSKLLGIGAGSNEVMKEIIAKMEGFPS